jgi:hypothetical protein
MSNINALAVVVECCSRFNSSEDSMLSRKNHRQNIVSFPQRSASIVTMLLGSFCIAYVTPLLCAPATVVLSAQTPAEAKIRAGCEAAVLKSGSPADPAQAKPGNVADGTKAALACEWLDPNGVEHVLRAFQLLASSVPSPDIALRVLQELEKGDPDSNDRAFYRAALGDPDENGPKQQGLPKFLDILAKANSLKKKSPKDVGPVFNSTEALIDEIFTKPATSTTKTQTKQEEKLEELAGPVALAIINDSFSRKDNYVALYQLLAAYPKDKKNYTANLETFRTAFELDASSLAKQISAKISAPKE